MSSGLTRDLLLVHRHHNRPLAPTPTLGPNPVSFTAETLSKDAYVNAENTEDIYENSMSMLVMCDDKNTRFKEIFDHFLQKTPVASNNDSYAEDLHTDVPVYLSSDPSRSEYVYLDH
jgi:hypothetical protein